jgi:hypothetical protein
VKGSRRKAVRKRKYFRSGFDLIEFLKFFDISDISVISE